MYRILYYIYRRALYMNEIRGKGKAIIGNDEIMKTLLHACIMDAPITWNVAP